MEKLTESGVRKIVRRELQRFARDLITELRTEQSGVSEDVSVDEAAELLGKSRQTIYLMLRQDRTKAPHDQAFPNASRPGAHWRIPRADIVNHINRHRRNSKRTTAS